MRLFLSFGMALVGCAVSLTFISLTATAQDPTAPASFTRAQRAIAAQTAKLGKGVSFQIAPNIRGVTNRSLSELCGTRVTPQVRQQLRASRTFRADPTPVPTASKFDLRERDPARFPVKNQLSCGSCWIFGAVAALEGNTLFKNPNSPFRFSEQYVGDCLYGKTEQPTADPCDGGFPNVSMRFLRDSGTVLESDSPYTGRFQSRNPTGLTQYRALNIGFAATNPNQMPSVDDIKKKINTYGAVVVAVIVGTPFQHYTGGVFDYDEGSNPDLCNHAIALVGWDDNPPEGGSGVWILRNSWGSDWGENGYMRIRYGMSSVGFAAMYADANVAGVQPQPPTPADRSATIQQRINWWITNHPEFTRE